MVQFEGPRYRNSCLSQFGRIPFSHFSFNTQEAGFNFCFSDDIDALEYRRFEIGERRMQRRKKEGKGGGQNSTGKEIGI